MEKNEQEQLNNLVRDNIKEQLPGVDIGMPNITEGVTRDIIEIPIDSNEHESVIKRLEVAPGTEDILKVTWILKKDGQEKVVLYEDVAYLKTLNKEDLRALFEASPEIVN